jgi:high-affinity nickel permease
VSTHSVLAIGFILGLKHATEADHVTAVATLVTGQRSLSKIVRQGIAWGLGHSLTLLSIGVLVLALGHTLPSWLAQALECAVGAMLMLLGADVLRRVLKDRVHAHSHQESALRSGGSFLRSSTSSPVSAHEHMSTSPFRALVVGMVHGMAGSAALIVLSLGAMQSVGRALFYIVTFGIGSVAGMAMLSAAIAYPLRLSAKQLGERHQVITALVGASSCALGAIVVYRIAIAG